MTQYVAFLRAVNVGGRTIKMDALRAHFEAMGADSVETYIASGNVFFESALGKADIESAIEAHLETELGYAVAAFVRTEAEVAKIAARTPFADVEQTEADRLFVNFLRRPLSAAARRELVALGTDEDRLAVVGPDVYWVRRGPLMESTLDAKAFDRIVGVSTNRNMNTVRKIAAKLAAR